MARIRQVETYVSEVQKKEREMADTRVKDVEEWIRIVQSRTRAIKLLRGVAVGEIRLTEIAAFLEEIEQ
jgi:hypothetical protein